MGTRRAETVLEYAIAKGGIRKGMRCATFIAQWTIAQQALGYEPTAEQAAKWWKESVSTWYRRREDFQQIFDKLETPAPIAAAAISKSEAQLDHVSDALASLTGVRYGVVGGVMA